jgi:hypothetical protein
MTSDINESNEQIGEADAETIRAPKSFSMEDAMQAIRDALGHRESLKPQPCNNQLQQELIPNLPKDDDFFLKRLAAIEEKNAHDIQTERLCQVIPLIIDCIKKMRLAGLMEQDMSVLFRQTANELDKAKTNAS